MNGMNISLPAVLMWKPGFEAQGSKWRFLPKRRYPRGVGSWEFPWQERRLELTGLGTTGLADRWENDGNMGVSENVVYP